MAASLGVLALATTAAAAAPDFGPDFNASKADNMNGEYVFSKTPGAGNMEELFPKRFADYPWVPRPPPPPRSTPLLKRKTNYYRAAVAFLLCSNKACPSSPPSRSGGAEYFEVYAPEISTLYSQVFWTSLAPAPLPDWVVKKYAGKAVAIIGWEIDQVG
jgi:hypothetical protein